MNIYADAVSFLFPQIITVTFQYYTTQTYNGWHHLLRSGYVKIIAQIYYM